MGVHSEPDPIELHAADLRGHMLRTGIPGLLNPAPGILARQVAGRVVDAERRVTALARLRNDTSKPLVNCWRPSGASMGGAGVAIMCAEFDQHFTGIGWDEIGHSMLAAGLAEVCAPDMPLSLFSGALGYASAVWLSSRRGTRYRALIESLDATFLSRMCTFAGRSHTAPDAYDIVNGIAGWTGYLLSREPSAEMDEVAQLLAGAFVSVLNETGLRRMSYRGDRIRLLDLGLAHGLAGPLAALALLETRYHFGRPDILESIRWAAQWFANKAVLEAGCLLWPPTVGLDSAGEVDLGLNSENAGSWCHGSSGVARALYLAGNAIDSAEYRDFAVAAMRTHCERLPVLRSPNLCHGVAGQLMLTLAFAQDTGDRTFERAAECLARRLIDDHRPDSLLGYQDVERVGLAVDNPGLLRGAAGVALALLASARPEVPAWTRLLLIA